MFLCGHRDGFLIVVEAAGRRGEGLISPWIFIWVSLTWPWI
jgi:hypothetical protein